MVHKLFSTRFTQKIMTLLVVFFLTASCTGVLENTGGIYGRLNFSTPTTEAKGSVLENKPTEGILRTETVTSDNIFTSTPYYTTTPEFTKMPTETLSRTSTQVSTETGKIQFSSLELNLNFFINTNWQYEEEEIIPDPSYQKVNNITLGSIVSPDKFTLVAFPKDSNLELTGWLMNQNNRISNDLTTILLNEDVFGFPAIIGSEFIDINIIQLYLFINRGTDVLEGCFVLQTPDGIVDITSMLSTLNPSDNESTRQNTLPDLAAMFIPITAIIGSESVTMEPGKTGAIAGATTKLLEVPFMDQVVIQYNNQKDQTPKLWNWCGAVSTAMALNYFGADKRNQNAAALDAFNHIFVPGMGNVYSRIPDYAKIFGVTAITHSGEGVPKYKYIETEIDAGRPIIYHNTKGSGHFFLIVGYTLPDKVIVHDPFGYYWNIKPPHYVTPIFDKKGNAIPQEKNAKNFSYSYKALAAIFRDGWVSFASNKPPTISDITPTSTMAGNTNVVITITGSNFLKNSLVKWNNDTLPVELIKYTSATKLTVTIPAIKFESGSIANITVFNHMPGGGTSNAIHFTVNNPKPALASLSHRVIAQKGPDLTITVTGAGFVPTSVVKFNTTTLYTKYISSMQLTAIIPASLRLGVGGTNITVFSPTPSGGTSAKLILARVDFFNPIKVVSYNSKKVLDVPNNSRASGVAIQQWTWVRNANQEWFVLSTGVSDEFWIISYSSQLCLTINSLNQGVVFAQQDCNFGTTQRFKRIYRSLDIVGKIYSLQSVYSSLYMDVRDRSMENGAVIQQYSGGTGANQEWYVLPAQ